MIVILLQSVFDHCLDVKNDRSLSVLIKDHVVLPTGLLPRPYLDKLKRTTSRSLRAELAKKAKAAKDPMVKKTISKTGKVSVSMS